MTRWRAADPVFRIVEHDATTLILDTEGADLRDVLAPEQPFIGLHLYDALTVAGGPTLATGDVLHVLGEVDAADGVLDAPRLESPSGTPRRRRSIDGWRASPENRALSRWRTPRRNSECSTRSSKAESSCGCSSA